MQSDPSTSENGEVRIVAFLCSWCSYRGADLAGSMRQHSPSSLRVVRVPCSGRVAPEAVLRIFQDGADGVLVLGCHLGDCHYLEGNHRMVRRMRVLRRLLGYAGIETDRLHWDFVSAAEGVRFVQVAEAFHDRVRSLPPIRSRVNVGDPDLHADETGPAYPTDHVPGSAFPDLRDQTLKGRLDPRWPALREAVRDALSRLDGVLALRIAHGEVAPYLFREEEELDELALWPRQPLPDVLRRLHARDPEARLGTVCRACEERSLVELAKRGQVVWDRIHLIGVECTSEEAATCGCSNTGIIHASTVVDAASSAPDDDTPEEPASALPETVEDRLAFWRYWSDRCIKCYGCVYACPQCFCPTCALESQLWVERGRVPPPFPTFHLIKAMHMAGRCTSCRECERVCPAEIPLTLLYRMVGRDVEELFDYRPGASLEAVPPLLLASEDGAHE